MLGHLGFHVEIEIIESEEEPCLQISPRSELLIGKDGERVDLQYLVNRVLRKHFLKAPRPGSIAKYCRRDPRRQACPPRSVLRPRAWGRAASLPMRPLNAYYRRLVHNAGG